jgi:regulatory protein
MSDYEKLVARAAKICSTAEKCSYDIREKLVSWGSNEAEAEKTISYLKKNQFLDDKRYAQFFVKDKLKFNKWGRVKIAYALRRKQIEAEVIENAIETIDEAQYEEILDQLLEAKIKSVGNIRQAAGKAKILRFAAQRGFASEEVFGSLKRIEKESSDNS